MEAVLAEWLLLCYFCIPWGCKAFDKNCSFTNCNQGIALSPLRSVQRNQSANSKLLAKLANAIRGEAASVKAPAFAFAA